LLLGPRFRGDDEFGCPQDLPTAASARAELLKKLGLNVELASSDWGSLMIRRASKKPVEEGGWSIFGTGWTGVETLDPSADLPLAANGAAAWFGWPDDEKLEALRTEWLKTPDSEARQEIAVKIQPRACETLPYIPTGQWSPVTAYRNNLKGIIIAPALFMWKVEKT
jgi:peptide/nickel transport system substrate-binding protein